MAEAARLRGPDIILRSAPSLSATSDAPLAAVPQPPTSASNHPDDIDAGVEPEMSAQEQGDARRAATVDPDAVNDNAEPADKEAKVAADKAADLDKITTVQVDGEDVPIPPWMQREITKSRNRQRDAEAKAKQLETASTEAAERLAKVEAELAELRAKAANTNPTNDNQATETEQPAADVRPTRDQFDDPEAYDEALAGWAEREGLRKAEAKATAEREATEKAAQEAREDAERKAAEAEIANLNATWTSRVEAFKQTHEDFEAVATADDVLITPVMGQAILRTENGPDVAYFLGQNKDEAARIAALHPAQQLMELGVLAHRLRTPPLRAPRQRPLEPIDGASNLADTSDREETMEEVANRVTSRVQAQRKPFVMGSRA